MESFFTWCAVLGGALFLIQLVMLLIGFEGFDSDVDVPSAEVGEFNLRETDVDFDPHPDNWLHNDGWFVGIVTFRSLVAAVTVFGLIGLATWQEVTPARSVTIAAAAGLGTLYLVGWSFKKLYDIRSDGTVRMQDTVGVSGNVYLSIPGQNAGAGKVTVKVGGRTMEYLAMTPGEPLKTGTPVVVTRVLNEQTLEVTPASRTEA